MFMFLSYPICHHFFLSQPPIFILNIFVIQKLGSKMSQVKSVTYKQHQFRLLYDSNHIHNVTISMAKQINSHYSELLKNEVNPIVTVICVLKGAFMFYSDLVKHLNFRVDCQFIKLSSYSGMNSTNNVKFQFTPEYQKFRGKHLLIIQDIIDTGKTLFELTKKLQTIQPKSIDIAVLVRRPDKKQQINCKFVGMDCSAFIVGYGLDVDEQFRYLPEIYQKYQEAFQSKQILTNCQPQKIINGQNLQNQIVNESTA